jgi:EpsD family peptidyl-prolyl cis-trans isomerase
LIAVLSLAACGGGGDEKKATQVAAKVNKDEITVHQVNQNLPRLNNPTEAQAKVVSKQVLDRLVDQQLFIQKAVDQKLDRDPQTMTAIENAKREILARAYIERVMANAGKPSPDQVKKFYAEHPELFSERRIFRLQEITMRLTPEQAAKVREALPGMKSLQDVANYAKANNIPANANNVVRAAEQLPMEFAARVSKMKDGEIVAVPGRGGMAVVQVVQSQSQPLDETKATPFIEQFLQNKARMEVAQTELKGLREAAKIEYVGEFAKTAAEAAAPAPEAAASPTEAPAPADAGSKPATGQDFLEKGLQGLKK